MKPATPTSACDKMKAIGQWNTAWDPFFELDPAWTDEFMAAQAVLTDGLNFYEFESSFV